VRDRVGRYDRPPPSSEGACLLPTQHASTCSDHLAASAMTMVPSNSHSHGTVLYSEHHSALHLAISGGPVKLQATSPCIVSPDSSSWCSRRALTPTRSVPRASSRSEDASRHAPQVTVTRVQLRVGLAAWVRALVTAYLCRAAGLRAPDIPTRHRDRRHHRRW